MFAVAAVSSGAFSLGDEPKPSWTCGGRQLFLSEQTSLLARDRSTMASRHLVAGRRAGGGSLCNIGRRGLCEIDRPP